MSTGVRTRPAPPSGGAPTPPPAAPPAPAARRPDHGREALLVPLLLLLAAASLPLGRVFIGWGFLRPVLATVVIVVGLSWACRRLDTGPVLALGVSALGWAVFVSTAFLPDTTLLGLLPTPGTFGGFRALWLHGFELIASRPPPTFAEPSLLLLTVTGVWALTHAVDGMVFRLQAPVKAILPALGLWLVPLLLTVGAGDPAIWTVPFLAASALLVLVATGTEMGRWGPGVRPRGTTSPIGGLGVLGPAGTLIAGIAITLGVLVAAMLPGFDDPPWYELGGIGGTTLTTNPMVSIRSNLVATDRGPVMRVTAEPQQRPVYLRTTALDQYSETGEWTNAGIRGTPVSGTDGRVPPESAPLDARLMDVEVEVVDLPGAVLVPAPYLPLAVTGPGGFQFDARLATLTTARGATLQPGDRYRVAAAVPEPDHEALRSLDGPPRAEDVALPANVPPEVTALAQDIVARAGARTRFDQALAIQTELRSWQYSLEPPQGHSGDAMRSFITNRIGYCEQYAGTMAVMLRALEIPARVAVGFTPGEQSPDGTYVVTNGNAHAWVEVHFPGHGWQAFEPTPRGDGNVLVPSAENPAPALTEAQASATEPVEVPATPEDSAVAPELPEDAPIDRDEPADQAAGGAVDADGGPGMGPWLLGLLIALAAVGGVTGLVVRRRADPALPPLARVLNARARVETVGRGLGMGSVASETDHEYLQRLTGTSTDPAGPATAVALARLVEQARYAPQVPLSAAEDAEASAVTLRDALLAGRSAPRRAAVLARGTASTAAARLGERARALLGRLGRG